MAAPLAIRGRFQRTSYVTVHGCRWVRQGFPDLGVPAASLLPCYQSAAVRSSGARWNGCGGTATAVIS